MAEIIQWIAEKPHMLKAKELRALKEVIGRYHKLLFPINSVYVATPFGDFTYVTDDGAHGVFTRAEMYSDLAKLEG